MSLTYKAIYLKHFIMSCYIIGEAGNQQSKCWTSAPMLPP